MKDDHDDLQECWHFIVSLKTAIKSNTRESQPFVVYRGLKVDEKDVQAAYRKGRKFLWPTFTSTSRNKKVARSFGNFLFVITVSSANGVTYFADIAKHSVYPGEEEVLFFPYSGFEVDRVDMKKKKVVLHCVDTVAVEKHNEIQKKTLQQFFGEN